MQQLVSAVSVLQIIEAVIVWDFICYHLEPRRWIQSHEKSHSHRRSSSGKRQSFKRPTPYPSATPTSSSTPSPFPHTDVKAPSPLPSHRCETIQGTSHTPISCYFPIRFHCVTDVRHSTFCHVIQQCFRHDIEQTEEMKCFNNVVSIFGKLAKYREVAGSTIFRNYWLCTLIILWPIFFRSEILKWLLDFRYSRCQSCMFVVLIALDHCFFLIHFQLPPVIKNMAFQKFSNMEQSLFTRFVRLGVPTVQLDAQGRARSRYIAYVLFGCLSNKCVTQQQIRHGGTNTSPN